jgi:hypothetical protein
VTLHSTLSILNSGSFGSSLSVFHDSYGDDCISAMRTVYAGSALSTTGAMFAGSAYTSSIVSEDRWLALCLFALSADWVVVYL